MPKINKLTPEQMQVLLASQNNSPVRLTAKEKFDRLKTKTKGTFLQIRKFHFCGIVTGNKVEIFDGNGISIAICDFSVASIRQARVTCLELFKAAPNSQIQGGYKFTVYGKSLEILSDEEIENAMQQIKRLLAYNPFKVCVDCHSQLEPEEFDKHSCIVGKTWAAF